MATINKKKMVETIGAKLEMPKAQVNRVINALVEALGDELANGNRVRISGLATFSVRETSPRMVRNPRTGKPMMVPLKRRVHTGVAKTLKEKVASGVFGTAILVSEGEPTVVSDIRTALASIGYTLGAGHNVKEALSAVQARPEAIDFVLVGPFLGEDDYDELAKTIKESKRTGGLPIVRAMASTVAIDNPKAFKILPDAVFEEAPELLEVVANEQERWREEKHYFVRQLKLRSPSDPDSVSKFGTFIEGLSSGILPDEGEAYQLASAFKEALENAAVHGNGSSADKYVEIHFYEDKKKITFEVTHEGEGFDFKAKLAAAKESKDDAGSLGLRTMAVCADDIEFFDDGKRVRLTKNKP